MSKLTIIKTVIIFCWILGFCLWFFSGPFARTTVAETFDEYKAHEYVGSETCKACHEETFKSFTETKHAKLSHLSDWKDKVQGCESCHGPGEAHVKSGGEIANIISFSNKTSKQISESCLTCHAGKEDHANYRRGEHWRNDVGCTDCHSVHDTNIAEHKTGSMVFISKTSGQKPGIATTAMLKTSEPQLCISCHSETKSQFNKPFHHKVLEGMMNCSDCHNPHGGFEQKQTRLAVGTDAACIKCHTDKQGPFVYEHAPVKVEGCAACHTPHGSSNPKLLKRNQVRQLCIECHSNIFQGGAPGVLAFHNQASVRYQNCTVCHAAIHGSNTHPDFFR